MQKPELKNFDRRSTANSFEVRVTEAQKEAETKVRRSFMITQENLDKVQSVALQMGQERRKVVSASEALRVIIEAYEVQQ